MENFRNRRQRDCPHHQSNGQAQPTKAQKTASNLSKKKTQAFQDIRNKRQKPLVLLVEDDRFSAQLLSACIDSYCDIIIAPNLEKAQLVYQWKLPDLVFLDIELPDGDGQRFLAKLKDIDPHSKIVMVSGHVTKHACRAVLTPAQTASSPNPLQRNAFYITCTRH